MEGGRVRQNQQAQEAVRLAKEEKDKIIEKIESLKQDNEAQKEAVLQRRNLKQAETDLMAVQAEALEANKVRVEEVDPEDLNNKTKIFDIY